MRLTPPAGEAHAQSAGKQHRTWPLGVLALLTLVAGPVAAIEISVASDPVSTYTLLNLKRVSKNVVEIATKRDAPMTGVSYSTRQIDCRNKTSRPIGEGATLEEMENDTKDELMEKLVEGTVPYDLAQYACANALR